MMRLVLMLKADSDGEAGSVEGSFQEQRTGGPI